MTEERTGAPPTLAELLERFHQNLFKSLGARPEYPDIERVFMRVAIEHPTWFRDASVIVDQSHPQILTVTATDPLDRALYQSSFQVVPAPPSEGQPKPSAARS